MTEQEFSKQFDLSIPLLMYRGLLVEKLIGGYRVSSHLAKSKLEVDKIIDGNPPKSEITLQNNQYLNQKTW
jgi:hypothetical protein